MSTPIPASASLSLLSDNLPAMYQTANQCSRSGQATYLRLVIASLAVLILGGAVTALPVEKKPDSITTAVAICSALLLLVSSILTVLIKTQRFEETWFAGRAVSESVKTLAWKYSVRAVPFEDDATADVTFVETLHKILEERRYLGAELVGVNMIADQITAPMRALRSSSLAERRAAYVRDRIQDQVQWYASKALANRAARTRWFVAVIGAQVFAATLALASVKWPELLEWPPVAVSVASAFLAWLQVKQHQELAQAYGIATHELNLLNEKVKKVQSEKELSNFVQDAENAISREHTLWIARRDHAN